MIEDLLYSYKLNIKKKYSNEELYLHQYFLKKTGIHPENIILHNIYVLFFVKNKFYFRAKKYLSLFRSQIPGKKILIIRAESSIIKLIMGFFPDIYIHDIELEINSKGEIIMHVYFLSYEERKIAIGRNGSYIKTVNEIFDKFIIPLTIKCEVLDI